MNPTGRTALRAEPGFAKFVKSLETAPTSGLGKDAEYALWINSYNALAIKMVADHPCKKSLLGLKKSKIASIKGKWSRNRDCTYLQSASKFPERAPGSALSLSRRGIQSRSMALISLWRRFALVLCLVVEQRHPLSCTICAF